MFSICNSTTSVPNIVSRRINACALVLIFHDKKYINNLLLSLQELFSKHVVATVHFKLLIKYFSVNFI